MKNTGPFLIMLAAALWAVDALLRGTLVQTMPAGAIVFYEHLIGFVILSPLFFQIFSKIQDVENA